MDEMFSFCLKSELDHMWHVVRIYGPAEVHQDEISTQSPLLLNCDFFPNGIRKLCTLQSGSLADVRTQSCSLMAPAGCNTSNIDADSRKGERSEVGTMTRIILSGILIAWHWSEGLISLLFCPTLYLINWVLASSHNICPCSQSTVFLIINKNQWGEMLKGLTGKDLFIF